MSGNSIFFIFRIIKRYFKFLESHNEERVNGECDTHKIFLMEIRKRKAASNPRSLYKYNVELGQVG